MGTRHISFVGIVSTLAIATMSNVAVAELVLDQSFIPGREFGPVIVAPSNPFDGDWAQTFTVGISGTLRRIDVGNNRVISRPLPGTYTLDLRSTVGGIPTESNSSILASMTGDLLTLPANLSVISFDLGAAGISVTAGQVLAITMRADAIGTFWNGNVSETIDPYTRGSAFYRPPGGVWRPYPLAGYTYTDHQFQTFVETAALPEPSSLFSCGIATVAGLCVRARRRRAAIV
jgi:hypothetical protein